MHGYTVQCHGTHTGCVFKEMVEIIQEDTLGAVVTEASGYFCGDVLLKLD